MNLQSEAARLRATRVSGFDLLDDGSDYLKEKGAEALDDGTSRLVQEGKDYVTEEYGESAGNIAGAALEGVQEEYFGTETPTQASTSQAMTSQAMTSQARTAQALRGSARFNRPMISQSPLMRLKALTKKVDLASDEYRDLHSKSIHKKLNPNQKALAASGRSYWIIGLSAVGVVGITAALVISANKNKKKKK